MHRPGDPCIEHDIRTNGSGYSKICHQLVTAVLLWPASVNLHKAVPSATESSVQLEAAGMLPNEPLLFEPGDGPCAGH
jgi:hypothetical protein